MKKINVDEVSWSEGKSPSGKFHRYRKELSVNLGAKRSQVPARGGHPFEVELVKVPAGAINWPLHLHTIEHEFYIIVSGTGRVRTQEGQFEVKAGDVFMHPPGEPHNLSNPGPGDLVYYVIADNQLSDSCYYPDSQKWANNDIDRCFRPTEVEYYDGED